MPAGNAISVLRTVVMFIVCILSNASLLGSHVQIPIDLTFFAVALLQPLVRLLEMSIIQETPMSAERAGMRALQHQMLAAVNTLHPRLGRLAPGQEHYTLCALCGHSIDDFLCELLPAFVGVRVCIVSAHSQACVEEQDAAVGPGREEAAVLGRWCEGWVVPLEASVDVG